MATSWLQPHARCVSVRELLLDTLALNKSQGLWAFLRQFRHIKSIIRQYNCFTGAWSLCSSYILAKKNVSILNDNIIEKLFRLRCFVDNFEDVAISVLDFLFLMD